MKNQKHAPSRQILLALLLALASFFFDAPLLGAMPSIKTPFLDIVLGFITNLLVVFIFFLLIPAAVLLVRKKVQETFFLCMAFLLSVIISISLKLVIHRPRPLLTSLDFAEPVAYSFPSLHAVVAFSLFILLAKEFPALRRMLFWSAALIGFTRLYFGVHYLSDVVWGGLIGYAVGWYLSHDHIIRPGRAGRLLKAPYFEIRRKLAHIALGLALVLCIKAGILTTYLLGVLILAGIIFSFLERKVRIPIISPLLDIFERPAARREFPGKGMLFFLLGVLLSLLLFPRDIALASIIVLTLGDAVSHIFGVRFGRVAHPLTDKKFLEGAIAGFIVAFLGALFFVPAIEALVGAFAAMLVEALEVRVKRLQVDDNALIPLAAGAAILLMRWISGAIG